MLQPLSFDHLLQNTVVCLDLDGTLIHEDITRIALLCLVKRKPWKIINLIFHCFKGRSFIKNMIASFVPFDWVLPHLHLKHNVCHYLQDHFGKSHTFCLITGASNAYAQEILKFIPFPISQAFGSTTSNLVGKEKAKLAQILFQSFVYVGDSWKDRFIFEKSVFFLMVDPPTRLVKWARTHCKNTENFTILNSSWDTNDRN